MAEGSHQLALHKRVVTRARFLQEHPPYCRALARAVADWNAAYPEFAIRRREIPPVVPPGVWPWPPALAAAVTQWHRLPVVSQTGPDRIGAVLVAAVWGSLVPRLCREWWLSEDFPAWFWSHKHPAAPFVAACLVWGEAMVDANAWIAPAHLPVWGLDFDPIDRENHPDRVAERERTAILHQLQAVLAAGESITEETLASLEDAGRKEAHDPARELPYLFVPVSPGMATTDWRALEASVRRQLKPTDDWLRDRARRLACEGLSQRQIAGRLGISERTAARMVAGA